MEQIALNKFHSDYEEPTREEGFNEEVKRVGFVGWMGGEGEGTEREMERKRWEGWMS